ncbi:hypothetical protein LA080_016297 [Diaporthe eres]|uniref:Celp0028 effector like protein n=1 Tax=Diaporthe vaccinii TaxID=105482 RepID=A0ABR4DZI9_9PEZI|nr:hypothetical protein LA080_016297 [Diaporthe eres]
MYIKPIALLSLLGAAQALAPPKILSPDDVIVPNDDGSYSIMKDYEYGIQKSKREMLNKRSKHSPPTAPSDVGALERRCDDTTEVQVLTDTNFVNWDVAMSPVISNTGSSIATIAVTKGYSISNSITVTESSTFTIIPEVLTVSLSIAVATSWTTENSQTFSFWVPAGQHGVVVSQPAVRRVTGNLVSGCADSPKLEPFTSDSYSSQTYSEMTWVKGPIILCNSTEYPIPFCNGNGQHK